MKTTSMKSAVNDLDTLMPAEEKRVLLFRFVSLIAGYMHHSC